MLIALGVAVATACLPARTRQSFEVSSPEVPIGVRIEGTARQCRYASLVLKIELELPRDLATDGIMEVLRGCVGATATRRLILTAIASPTVAMADATYRFGVCVSERARRDIAMTSSEAGIVAGEWGAC
jgi:hypothetical protein